MSEKVIAFDPGYTTGVADYEFSSKSLVLEEVKGLWEVHRVLDLREPDTIIYEKFFYQRRDKVDLTPVEVIGVIKLYAEFEGVQLVGQSAAQAKRFWTDSKIKRLGLWQPGQPHAMDALRHLLYYQAFYLKDKELLMRVKPE